MKLAALVLPLALVPVFVLTPVPDLRADSGLQESPNAVAASGTPQAGTQAAPGSWHAFEGGWSASGHRETLPTEGGRPASTVYLSGAVFLNVREGVSRGFRGEMIGFDDGRQMSAGRCVWTDERGDRIFSTITGETIGAGRRFVGTITGGTGRYAGISGEYAFEWQYVVEAESGSIQGRAISLKGRYRGKEGGR